MEVEKKRGGKVETKIQNIENSKKGKFKKSKIPKFQNLKNRKFKYRKFQKSKSLGFECLLDVEIKIKKENSPGSD